MHFFVFYCLENHSIAITLEPLVQFRWGFQQNEDFNQIKLIMSHVWLPTDSPWSHHIYPHNTKRKSCGPQLLRVVKLTLKVYKVFLSSIVYYLKKLFTMQIFKGQKGAPFCFCFLSRAPKTLVTLIQMHVENKLIGFLDIFVQQIYNYTNNRITIFNQIHLVVNPQTFGTCCVDYIKIKSC